MFLTWNRRLFEKIDMAEISNPLKTADHVFRNTAITFHFIVVIYTCGLFDMMMMMT